MFASKPLFSALALILALGVSVPAAAEPPHGRHAGKAHKAKKPHKLHPACKKYLDRRAKWYRLKGDNAGKCKGKTGVPRAALPRSG